MLSSWIILLSIELLLKCNKRYSLLDLWVIQNFNICAVYSEEIIFVASEIFFGVQCKKMVTDKKQNLLPGDVNFLSPFCFLVSWTLWDKGTASWNYESGFDICVVYSDKFFSRKCSFRVHSVEKMEINKF